VRHVGRLPRITNAFRLSGETNFNYLPVLGRISQRWYVDREKQLRAEEILGRIQLPMKGFLKSENFGTTQKREWCRSVIALS